MKILFFIGFILLVFLQSALEAVNRDFSHLTIKDGLSQSSIFDILQDKKGFLWLTTQDGLNRYDGYSFKVFRHLIGDSLSLSDNSLGKLIQDKNGDIWVSTIHGNINQYHHKSGTFSVYHLNGIRGIEEDANFTSMVYDSSGFIWFGINGAIGKINIANKNITIYRTYFPGRLIGSPSLFADRKNRIWAGDEYGLYLFNLNDDQFELLNLKGITSGLVRNIKAIAEDKAGNLWAAMPGRAPLCINTGEKKIIPYKYKSPEFDPLTLKDITSILCTSTTEVVIATRDNGIYIFNPQSGIAEHLHNDPIDKNSISFNYVLSLYEDRSQNLWVGTLKGLDKLDLKPKKFETFRFGTAEDENITMLPVNVVLSVYADREKRIWLGTNSYGLFTIDISNNKVKKFNRLSFKGEKVWVVRELDRRKYLIGTEKGLNLIDLKKGKSAYFPYDLEGDNDEYFVRDMADGGNGKFWVGTLDKGLLLFDVNKMRFYPVYMDKKGEKPKKNILSVYKDHSSILWIGTRLSGLFYYNPSSGLLSKFHLLEDKCKDEFKRINSIVEDKQSKLWVATENGLICIDENRKNIVHYSVDDGLLSSFIYSVEVDNRNNIWVSTNSGLSKIHLNKYGALLVYNFTDKDGLQANEFDTNCSFKDVDGKLYFGGIEGLNVFDPQKIFKNPHIPTVVISRIVINKKTIDSEDSEREITLEPYHSNLEFTFSALDFTNTQSNQYAYKLDGFDTDWVYSGVKNSVRYTGLAPGDYVFYVKGTNNDGVWSDKIKSVKVHVLTPWWETAWARVIYVLLLVLLTVFLIVFRTRKVIKDKIELNKKVKQITGELQANYRKLEKTKTELINSVKRRALTVLADGMAHDFNNLLFVILNSAQLLKNEVDTPEKKKLVENIEISAVDAAAIIKRVQDFSTNNDHITQDAIVISNVLLNAADLIKPKIEEAQKNKKISIAIKKSIEVDWISYGSISEFRLALTNILINAVESFEKSGAIMITSRFDGKDTGVIEISDEGKGMAKEVVDNIFDPFFTTKGVHNSGLGLSQAYGIITRYNGTITVESKQGKGTKIVINLPAKLKKDDRIDKAAEQDIAPQASANGEKMILVVEDELVIRELYSDILSMQGYHSVMAETGEEGVEKWESGSFSMVICDLGLPGLLSGWDVIEKIRKKDSKIPILVVTGWGNSIERSKIEKYQVNKVLSKPVPIKDLVNEIAAMVN
jgi:ligand-binding sensor domain-containing protein/signal transduction histidine kinase/CheY-like chemotaxis protein